MMNNQSLTTLTADATLSQITSADQQAGKLLASIGLDPSLHSDETLRSLCQQKQWSEIEVLKWLKKHSLSTNGDTETENIKSLPDEGSSIAIWTNFIEKTFISPNLSLLKELKTNFPRIHKIHGNQYPWLKHIQCQFSRLEEVLSLYYEFERNRFFPLTQRLVNSKKASISHGTVLKLQKSFIVLEKDQNRLKHFMTNMRDKSIQFQNPPKACSTLRIQNENFKILFSNLDRQFKIESEKLFSQIKEKIKLAS